MFEAKDCETRKTAIPLDEIHGIDGKKIVDVTQDDVDEIVDTVRQPFYAAIHQAYTRADMFKHDAKAVQLACDAIEVICPAMRFCKGSAIARSLSQLGSRTWARSANPAL